LPTSILFILSSPLFIGSTNNVRVSPALSARNAYWEEKMEEEENGREKEKRWKENR
jgi:hypothetical protein